MLILTKLTFISSVSQAPGVVECDMSKVPLKSGSVDVVVFCLSLMGTNIRVSNLDKGPQRSLDYRGGGEGDRTMSFFNKQKTIIRGFHRVHSVARGFPRLARRFRGQNIVEVLCKFKFYLVTRSS